MSADDKKKRYGIYIHIPFCRSKCGYCAFTSVTDFTAQKPYVNALKKEMRSSAARGAAADTVYIGGGTPSCLYDGAISDIIACVRDCFDVRSDAEITVECNPESATENFVSECADCGVNRISMGLQSSCDDVLRAVGRIHSFSDYLSAVKRLKTRFDNISSDIILGLPRQTPDDISESVSVISEYCDHISVYALSVEDGTPIHESGYIPNDDFIADLYALACERLRGAGFDRYEVSNFARNGRQSEHNNKYWNCEPYLGFGVAAHGYDGEYTRYKHTENIAEYISSPHAESYGLTDKDRFNEYVMLRLRTESGLSCDDFMRRFGYSLYDVRAKEIAQLSDKGYILEGDGRVRIAPEYMFVMNGIIENLMLD